MSLGTSSDSDSNDIVNLEDGDGWEDVEPDIEKVKIVSLFSDDEFDDIKTMLEHCKVHHQFDLIKIRKELGVYDFLHLLVMEAWRGLKANVVFSKILISLKR